METNVFLYFSTVGLFYLEIIIGFLFFNPNIKKVRTGLPFRIVMAFFFSFGLSFAMYAMANRFYWNYATNLLLYLVMFLTLIFDYFLIFDCSFKDAILVLTLCYCVQHISYQVLFLGYETWVYSVLPTMNESLYMAIGSVDLMAQLLLMILISFLLQGVFKRNYRYSISSSSVFSISLVTLIVVVALNTATLKIANWVLLYRVIASLLCLLSCILILLVILGFFEKNRYRDESLKIEMDYREKMKQFEMSKEAVEYINIKCHDLRKKIRDFKNNKDILDEEEIDKIANTIKIYDETFQTGNEVLDRILTSKSLVLQKNGIELTVMCEGKSLSVFSNSDLISLFTNILDNAVEAVMKIPQAQNRYISLIVKTRSGFLYIEQSNPYVDKVEIRNDFILTTKRNKYLNGFGTKSISLIVRNHGGKVNYDAVDGIFTLRILVPVLS